MLNTGMFCFEKLGPIFAIFYGRPLGTVDCVYKMLHF